MSDPTWAREKDMTAAQVWEVRANEQLERARTAEERAQEAERQLRRFEAFSAVKAVGKDPVQAIEALAQSMEWGEVTKVTHLDGAGDGEWARCFVAGGTSFKASGHLVPGGVTLTWWK